MPGREVRSTAPADSGALASTEAATRVGENRVPDDLYHDVRQQIHEKNVPTLSWQWRLSTPGIVWRFPPEFVPGTYEVPKSRLKKSAEGCKVARRWRSAEAGKGKPESESPPYCWGAKYPLRARTCRSFFSEEISIER